jgi:multisubunit Na+/H+ antiporter MnhB subunit
MLNKGAGVMLSGGVTFIEGVIFSVAFFVAFVVMFAVTFSVALNEGMAFSEALNGGVGFVGGVTFGCGVIFIAMAERVGKTRSSEMKMVIRDFISSLSF